MGKYIVPILSGVVGFLLASWILVFSSAKDFVVDFGNVADWVVAFCTIGILIGTWKAAKYAKNAAEQARVQNNIYLSDRINQLYIEIKRSVDYKIDFLEKIYLNKNDPLSIYDDIDDKFGDKHNILFQNELFITSILNFTDLGGFSDFDEFINCVYLTSSKTEEELNAEFEEEYFTYVYLTDNLLSCLKNKYKELNGSP